MDPRPSFRPLVSTFVLLLLVAARVQAASVTLAWDPSPDPAVTGYLLQYGTQSGVYTSQIDVGNRTQYSLLSIPEGTYYFVVVSYNAIGGISGPSAEVSGVVHNRYLPATTAPNFDADKGTDLTVWRPSTGAWTWLSSTTGLTTSGASGIVWGSATLGDVPLSGDIDGDGINDVIVWRASTGTWFWLTSTSGYSGGGSKAWGSQALGDVPMLSDIDGDGADDLVVWRASTGTWYWLTSSSEYDYAVAGAVQWGSRTFGDVPMLGDLDGDGRADLVVWRATNGTWYWLSSSSGYAYASARAVQWGNSALGDQPLIGDFDGDHRSDLAVWRASTGLWYWLLSSTGYAYAAARSVQWGNQSLGDRPYLVDMDGDGKADPCVWRTSTSTWYWLNSSMGYASAGARQFGSSSAGDIPVLK
jgi:hypothetical protein